jgi:mRNA interferase MazF
MNPGEIWWIDLGRGVGREQSGPRPVLSISSMDYTDVVDSLAIVIPCTTKNRSWPNHIHLQGDLLIERDTFAMTEQIRTISRDRLIRPAGRVNSATMQQVGDWINRWLA